MTLLASLHPATWPLWVWLLVAPIALYVLGVVGVRRYHPGEQRHRGNIYATRWTCCGAPCYDRCPPGCRYGVEVLGREVFAAE